MAQSIVKAAKEMVRKALEALMPAPQSASQQRRPQLNGRRGYGEADIKSPNEGDRGTAGRGPP